MESKGQEFDFLFLYAPLQNGTWFSWQIFHWLTQSVKWLAMGKLTNDSHKI
jgi:hypothetical protein